MKADIIKKDLVAVISNELDVTAEAAERTLTKVLNTIIDSVSEGGVVSVRGFGTFQPLLVTRKKARDIKNNETIPIKPHYKPKFKAGEQFSERVKQLKID